MGPVCEETFLKGEVLVVVMLVGGNMASTLLLSSIFISLHIPEMHQCAAPSKQESAPDSRRSIRNKTRKGRRQ